MADVSKQVSGDSLMTVAELRRRLVRVIALLDAPEMGLLSYHSAAQDALLEAREGLDAWYQHGLKVTEPS